MSAWQRDFVLTLILGFTLQSCYSAREAHRHTHEAVNACSATQVFDKIGRRIEE